MALCRTLTGFILALFTFICTCVALLSNVNTCDPVTSYVDGECFDKINFWLLFQIIFIFLLLNV